MYTAPVHSHILYYPCFYYVLYALTTVYIFSGALSNCEKKSTVNMK